MYLGQVSRYDILFTVNQLARAMPNSSKAHMGAAKRLLLYLIGSVNLSVTYKRGGSKLAVYSNVNWGSNLDNSKSTSLFIVMLTDGPLSFKVSLQSLTTQPTMEMEFMAAALTMKGAVFFPNMVVEVGFEKGFSSVPLYLDNTSTLHVVGNRSYSARAKYTALRYFSVQELVEEGKTTIHYVNTQDQLADLGPKHLGRHCHRSLTKLINDFET